jgi:zona occludens toxin
MAITAYVGLPGSGKSYSVVENVIIPALKDGQKVFTNIPMKNDFCFDNFGNTVSSFDIAEIIENPNWWTEVFEAGSILVIDELWRLWPAGLTINKARMQDKEFLAEHRHLVNQDTGKSTSIALVTQDLAQISNFCKLLVDKTFKTVKLDAVGANKSFRVDIYQGEVSGTNIPDKNKLNSQFSKYKKEVFNSYVSHTKSDIAGDESSNDDRFNFLKSTKFKLVIIGLFLPFIFAYVGLSKVEDEYYKAPEPKTIQNPVYDDQQPFDASQVASNGVTTPIKPRKPKFTFLSDQDEVFISFNMGSFPDLLYIITVESQNSYSADFTESQLTSLDYTLTPVSTCAVRITGSDFDSIVLCRSDKEQRNAIERAVSTSNE